MPRLVLFAYGLCERELRHLPAFGQIGLLPRHILGVLAEVAVAGNLAEPRAAQIKALDDRGRAHIHGGDERLNLFAVNLLRAEGIAQARMVEAEAEKEAIKRIIEALSSKGQADKYLIAMKYLETMKEMTSGQDNKIVYMPYEASAVLSSVDGIREMLSAKKGA